MEERYDIFAIVTDLESGLSKADINYMLDKLVEMEYIPFFIDDENGTIMGFMTIAAERRINYESNMDDFRAFMTSLITDDIRDAVTYFYNMTIGMEFQNEKDERRNLNG